MTTVMNPRGQPESLRGKNKPRNAGFNLPFSGPAMSPVLPAIPWILYADAASENFLQRHFS